MYVPGSCPSRLLPVSDVGTESSSAGRVVRSPEQLVEELDSLRLEVVTELVRERG
jgi:hypothetical protein